MAAGRNLRLIDMYYLTIQAHNFYQKEKQNKKNRQNVFIGTVLKQEK